MEVEQPAAVPAASTTAAPSATAPGHHVGQPPSAPAHTTAHQATAVTPHLPHPKAHPHPLRSANNPTATATTNDNDGDGGRAWPGTPTTRPGAVQPAAVHPGRSRRRHGPQPQAGSGCGGSGGWWGAVTRASGEGTPWDAPAPRGGEGGQGAVGAGVGGGAGAALQPCINALQQHAQGQGQGQGQGGEQEWVVEGQGGVGVINTPPSHPHPVCSASALPLQPLLSFDGSRYAEPSALEPCTPPRQPPPSALPLPPPPPQLPPLVVKLRLKGGKVGTGWGFEGMMPLLHALAGC